MIWQRSCLYRTWVVLGLLAVVGVVLYVGMNYKPGDTPPYPVIGVAVGGYLLGIIVLQAVDLVRRKPAPVAAVAPDHVPVTPEELMGALTLPGADAQRALAGAQGSRRFSIALFIPTALIAILLPLGGYLYISGAVTGVWSPFGASGIGIPVAALPGLLMVLVLALMLPMNLRKARKLSDETMSGLGLRISSTPSVILLPRIGTDGVGAHVVGPTTLEGLRYGRHVVVEAGAGATALLVERPTEPFELTGSGGSLRVQSGPAWLTEQISRVPEDHRWNRVRFTGGPQGVQVRRKGSGVDAEWMLDLWLTERLLDKAPPVSL